MVIKAVLFDLDGTLVDSAPDLQAAVNAVLAQSGLREAALDDVRSWIGNGAAKLIERAFRHQGHTAGPQHVTGFFSAYERVNGRYSRLFDGVAEGIAALGAAGLPLAVVTNKPLQFVGPLLDRFAIGQHFAELLGGDSVPNKKPAPDMVLEACRRLAVTPDMALVVGDSRNDIQAAIAAGSPLACVRYGYNHGEPIEQMLGDTRPLWVGEDLRGLVAALGARG